MRSIDIAWQCDALKPNTRMYLFFDGEDVNAYVKPTGDSAQSTQLNGALAKTVTTITVDSTTGFPTTGTIVIGTEQMTYTGVTATTFTGVTRNSDSALLEASEHADDAAVTGSVNSMPLISDSVGTLTGTYTVPSTATVRLKLVKEFLDLQIMLQILEQQGLYNQQLNMYLNLKALYRLLLWKF